LLAKKNQFIWSLQHQLEALAARLRVAGPRDAAAAPRPDLALISGWLDTPARRRKVKCLFDSKSGASHCLLSGAFAAQLPQACLVPPTAGHPPSVRQADGSTRPTGGVVAASARLMLGDLMKDTRFVEFDMECDADLILGYNWLSLAARPRSGLSLRL
jgi:hypothetical protein